MKVSRRGFLKGATASTVSGLLLSRAEALESELVSPEQKGAIIAQPRSMDHVIHEALEDGPEYLFWQGRLYLVTDWSRTFYTEAMEELKIGGSLIGETG